MRNKLKTLITNTELQKFTVYGFGQLFNLITPLLVIPYIVSICGIENYGKMSIGMAISFFLMVFIDYGSDIIGVKDAAVNRDNSIELEQIFLKTFSLKLVLLLIVLLICSLIFYFIPFFNTEKELFFLGLPILVGQFLNPTWFLQGIENFKWITILTIISKFIYLFGIFFFINQKGDYIYINLWWGIGTIVANVLTCYYILKKHSFSLKRVSNIEVIQLLKDNFSIFFSQIFVSLQMYAPIMLIGFFGNNILAGQYKIVEQIIVVFKTYIFLFFNFMYPRVCYLLDKSIKQGIHFWKLFNGINFIFILISMILIYCFSFQAVSYFTKSNIQEICDLLKLAVLIPLLLSISIPLKQLLLGNNQQQLYIRVTMFMVIINLIAMIALMPFYKIYGVIISLIFTEAITIFIYYSNLKTVFKESIA
ncbi:MAG: oligosaccharide flippase family protein [Bacteroidota bacterium]